MRFRVVKCSRGVPRRPAPAAQPPQEKTAPPRAADLDNPYGRYYGKARSREDLKNDPLRLASLVSSPEGGALGKLDKPC